MIKTYNILHTIPDFHIGGVSNLLLNVIKNFNDPQVNHHICYFGTNITLLQDFKDLNVKIHKINYEGKFNLLKAVLKFNKLLRSEKIDIIHSHLMLDRFIVGVSSFLNNIPIVITIHTTNSGADHKQILKKLKLKGEDILGRTTASNFIGISQTVKEVAVETRLVPAHKIHVIYSGVKIGHSRNNSILQDQPINLISVGRLIKSKGFIDLIFVMDFLRNEKKKFHLTIVGDGPEGPKLKQHVKDLELENMISFTGFTKDVPQFLRNSNIFLTASKEEGFSISTVEAMALSLPVITYDIPIFKELSENGKIFPIIKLGDTRMFANEILRITEKSEVYSRYSKESFEKAKNDFDIKVTAEKYINLYKSIVV